MSLEYSTIMNATISLQQCKDTCNLNMVPTLIIALIGLLLLSGILIYIAFQNGNMSAFIKEEKLQEKYQKHKKVNKGL